MKYNIKNLELVSFLKDDENYISGDEMVSRASDYNALSDEKLKDWLLENQKDIPKEWRDYYIVFPLLRNRDGRRCVLYLDWLGGQWVVDVYWLDDNFLRLSRFVRSREFLDSGKLGASGDLDTWPLDTLEINNHIYKLVK